MKQTKFIFTIQSLVIITSRGNLAYLEKNQQITYMDLSMKFSTETKKSSYSMQTVAVQIYDCINNKDENLWNMLDVYKWTASYFIED